MNTRRATNDPAGIATPVRGLLAQDGQHYAQDLIGVDAVLARVPSSAGAPSVPARSAASP